MRRMEYLQLSLDCWDTKHGQTGQYDGLVFVLLINGWLEVDIHYDWRWHLESLICES